MMHEVGIESLPEGAIVVSVGLDRLMSLTPLFRVAPSQLATLQMAARFGGREDLNAFRAEVVATVEKALAKEARRRAKLPEGRAVHVPRHLYAEQGPVHLVPARDLGLPCYDDAERGGRVYTPDPMRGRPIGSEEADHDPLADERARLNSAALEPGQIWRLSTAEFYTERGKALREARPKGARIGAEERAAADTSRRILIRLRREVLEKGETDAARRRILNAEHLADQEGRAGRRRAMQIKRAVLLEAGANRWERVQALWAYRSALRVERTGRNVDGLKLVTLNPIQRSAAEWYRDLYERTERGARVANMEGRVGGDPQDRKVKDWGADQIIRKQIEARVMTLAAGNGRMITTLRLVAGEGRTISSISAGKSHTRKLNTEALIQALDVVADYRGMQ